MAHRELPVATFMDWEACYLPEWLAFHFKLGVTRVYLFPSWSPTHPSGKNIIRCKDCGEPEYGEAPSRGGPFQNMFFQRLYSP